MLKQQDTSLVTRLIQLSDYLKDKDDQEIYAIFGKALVDKFTEFKVGTVNSVLPRTEEPSDNSDQSSNEDSDTTHTIESEEESDEVSDVDNEQNTELLGSPLSKKQATELKKLQVFYNFRKELIEIFNDDNGTPLEKLILFFKLTLSYLESKEYDKKRIKPIITYVFEEILENLNIAIKNSEKSKRPTEENKKEVEVKSEDIILVEKNIHELQIILQSLYVGQFLKALNNLKESLNKNKKIKNDVKEALDNEINEYIKQLIASGNYSQEGHIDVRNPKSYYFLASRLINEILLKIDPSNNVHNSKDKPKQLSILDKIILAEACKLQQSMRLTTKMINEEYAEIILDSYRFMLDDLIFELTKEFDNKNEQLKVDAYLRQLASLVGAKEEDYINFAKEEIENLRANKKLTATDYQILKFCKYILLLPILDEETTKAKVTAQDDDEETTEKEIIVINSSDDEEGDTLQNDKPKRNKGKEKIKDVSKLEQERKQALDELNLESSKELIKLLKKELNKIKKSEYLYKELNDILEKAEQQTEFNLDWVREYTKVLSLVLSSIEYDNGKKELAYYPSLSEPNKKVVEPSRNDDFYKKKNFLIRHLAFLNEQLSKQDSPDAFLFEYNNADKAHKFITTGKYKDTLSYIQLEVAKQNAIYRLNKYKFDRFNNIKLGIQDRLGSNNPENNSTRDARIFAANRMIDSLNNLAFDIQYRDEQLLIPFKKLLFKKEDEKYRDLEKLIGGKYAEELIKAYETYRDSKNRNHAITFKEFFKEKTINRKIYNRILFLFNLYAEVDYSLKQTDAYSEKNVETKFISECQLLTDFYKLIEENYKEDYAFSPSELKIAYEVFKDGVDTEISYNWEGFYKAFKYRCEIQNSKANRYEKYLEVLSSLKKEIKNIKDKGSDLRNIFYEINNDIFSALNKQNSKNPVISQALKLSNEIHHQKILEDLISDKSLDDYIKNNVGLSFKELKKPKLFFSKLAYKIQDSMGFLLVTYLGDILKNEALNLRNKKENEYYTLIMLKNYLSSYSSFHSENGHQVVEFYVTFIELCAQAQLKNTDPSFRKKIEEAQVKVLQRLNANQWLKLTSLQQLRIRKARQAFKLEFKIPEENAESQKYKDLYEEAKIESKQIAELESAKQFEQLLHMKLNNYFYAQKVIASGKVGANPTEEKNITSLLRQVSAAAGNAIDRSVAPMAGTATNFLLGKVIDKADNELDDREREERHNAVMAALEGKDADHISEAMAKALTIMYLDPIRRVIHPTEIEKFAECMVERVTNAIKNNPKKEDESNSNYAKRIARETRNCAIKHKHWVFEMPIATQQSIKEKKVTVEAIIERSVPITVDNFSVTYYEPKIQNKQCHANFGFVCIESKDINTNIYQGCNPANYNNFINNDHANTIKEIRARQKVLKDLSFKFNETVEGSSDHADFEETIEHFKKQNAQLKEERLQSKEKIRQLEGQVENLTRIVGTAVARLDKLEKEKPKAPQPLAATEVARSSKDKSDMEAGFFTSPKKNNSDNNTGHRRTKSLTCN